MEVQEWLLHKTQKNLDVLQSHSEKTHCKLRSFTVAAKKVLDEEQVFKVKAGLEKIALSKESQSLTKSIQSFKTEIRAARKAGRTWKEIANIFSEVGVQVSESLLATECGGKRKKIQTKQNSSKATAQKGLVKAQVSHTQNSGEAQEQERRRPTIKPDRAEL